MLDTFPAMLRVRAPHDHTVQLYEQDDFLLDEVSRFLATGFKAGHAAVVIAAPEHREGLERRLEGLAGESDGYIALDAAATLSQFMSGDRLDEQRFHQVIGQVIRRAARNGRQVRAFGEMVSLLWAEGRRAAACRLEELWNDLAVTHSFSLLCAYPLARFRDERDSDSFLQICNSHSHVRPAESFEKNGSTQELHRQVALMQQKAAALESEIAKRAHFEKVLQELTHDLRSPLGAIASAVELMRLHGNDPAWLVRPREIVARQTELMTRLVDDLLAFTRITGAENSLQPEELVAAEMSPMRLPRTP